MTNSNLIVTTSWDDGHNDDIKVANLLEKYSLKGTFYITKNVETPLSIEETMMLDKKFEIGGHTLNHPSLDIVDVECASREILDSKKYLENMTGHEISMFSYPRGRYNDNIKYIVKNSGFIGARTCGFNNFNGTKDKYEFHPTLYLSNASPMSTFKMYVHNVISISSLMDWEMRARDLFDKFLKHGGIFHIWGHSWEFERKNEWDKLERIFKYISNRENIKYLSNGEIIKYLSNGEIIKYPSNGEIIKYPSNGEIIKYPSNGEIIKYPSNGEIIKT